MNVVLEKINELIMLLNNMFYVDLVRNELNYPSQTKTVLYYFLNTISFVFFGLYLLLIVLDIVWLFNGTVTIIEFLLYLLGTPFLIKFTLWLQITAHGIRRKEE